MKLAVFLILMTVLQANAGVYAQTITLEVSNTPLPAVMERIQAQSGYLFFLKGEKLAKLRVDAHIKEALLPDALDMLTNSMALEWVIKGKTIVIRAKENGSIRADPAIDTPQENQQRAITGRVTDETGNPLEGVTVIVKGTTAAAFTDSQGNYRITLPDEGNILSFSIVGFESAERTIGNQHFLNVTLNASISDLDEVVVVGYGTQRKVTLTGAVSTVGGDKIRQSPSISMTNSLAGRLPGVFANNRSGEPGADLSSILIRGRSTLGSTSPLFVIDGVWGRGGYNELDPNEIESVTVLKDASAAIYGAQAANGVILITTKRGIEGQKPTFNYTMNLALSQPTRWPEMANAAEAARVYNDMLNREGQGNRFSEEEIAKFGDGSDPFNYPNTDWVNETFKTFGSQQQHNLSLQGGGNRVKYYLSGSYSDQNSVVKKGIHDYAVTGLRSNIDATVTDNIKLSLDLSMTQSDRLRPNAGTGTIFGTTMYNFPWLVAYYPNGLPGPGLERGENPVVMATDAGGYRKTRHNLYQSTFRYDINIPWIEGLGIDGFVAYDRINTFNKNWLKPWTVYNYNAASDHYDVKLGGSLTQPQLTEESVYVNRLMLNAKLKYERRFDEHGINAFIAFEQSRRQDDSFSALRRNFMSEAIDQLFAGDEQNQVANGTASELSRRNFLGRFSYGYKDRYLLDFDFRFDGSSIFPKDHRWGFFPGVSLGWRVSEEEFFKQLSSDINSLKIRASWGQMGNDAVAAFQYLSTFTFTNGYFLGSGSDPVKGITHGVSPNPYITWEVQNSYNLGVDLTAWNGMLGITADVFKNRRNNILTARNASIPSFTGLSLPNENIGIVENKGVELELSHLNRKGEWTYAITGNISFARNKIINIDEAAAAQPWQRQTGLQMGTSLYYITEGIYRTQEEIDNSPHPTSTRVGDLKYKDINEDGQISAADRIRLNKTNTPELIFGLNLSASYKGFDMNMLLQGQGRAWQYLYTESGLFRNTLKDLAVNRYSESNPDSKYPQLASQGGVSGYQSTFWLKDATFLRLKNLEIGYTLPETLLSKIKVEKFRIYANGFNLLILYDKIKWFDPEATSMASFYPQNRIINFGLNLTF